MKPEFSEVEDYNLGTEEQPQYVKLSKTLCSAEKAKYAKLFKELKDVFAWKYSDLRPSTSINPERRDEGDIASIPRYNPQPQGVLFSTTQPSFKNLKPQQGMRFSMSSTRLQGLVPSGYIRLASAEATQLVGWLIIGNCTAQGGITTKLLVGDSIKVA